MVRLLMILNLSEADICAGPSNPFSIYSRLHESTPNKPTKNIIILSVTDVISFTTKILKRPLNNLKHTTCMLFIE